MAYNYSNYPYQQPMSNQQNYSYNQNYQLPGPNQMPQMQQMPMQNTIQRQPSNSINWVQGEAAARSYQLNPGESALLMDSEAPVLYAKTVDVYGRPMPMEIYDLVKRDTIVDSNQSYSRSPGEQYVKVSELEDKIYEIVRKAMEKKGE